MSTTSHGTPQVAQRRWSLQRVVPEVWASLAITAMWVAVFITAIWGPDARFNGNDGSSSTIPTAVFVTVFAFLGTWVVARHGFRQDRK
jgi:TRAP-type C4-dicarboxylate transport system permease small subunit